MDYKKKYNILGIIPARGGSKTIKKKNIVLINKHPLIAYTIFEAKKSKLITDLIVSSDSDEIRATAIQYGCKSPFRRPYNLSNNNATSVDCDLHATKFMENKLNKKYDFVVELMCTNPFKTVEDIDGVIKTHIKTKAETVIAMMKLEDHHPIRIKKVINGLIKDFCAKEIPETRRQDLKPDAYIRNGSIYSMRRDILEKRIRTGAKNSRAFIMPRERTVNIDEPMDLHIARTLMKLNPKKKLKPLMSFIKAQKKLSLQ